MLGNIFEKNFGKPFRKSLEVGNSLKILRRLLTRSYSSLDDPFLKLWVRINSNFISLVLAIFLKQYYKTIFSKIKQIKLVHSWKYYSWKLAIFFNGLKKWSNNKILYSIKNHFLIFFCSQTKKSIMYFDCNIPKNKLIYTIALKESLSF